MNIETHSFRLPASQGGLWCSVNRYTPTPATRYGPEDGVSLIFAHCTSAHKEQWEPTISKIFKLAAAENLPVHEAWSLDCTNHGDSAVLNENLLSDENPISVKDYGMLLRYFANSEFLKGRARVVGVGHSSSTSAWCLAVTLPNSNIPLPALSMLILVEPVMVPPPIVPRDPRIEMGKRNVEGVKKRRDRWANETELRKWLSKSFPYRIWDPRILDIYVKYGFKSVEDAEGTQHVTYKCGLSQEVGFYTPEDHVLAGETIAQMCARLPVHAIWSERPEMVSLKSRKIITDATEGRIMASTSIAKGTGHLAVQENPDSVALAIFKVLKDTTLPSILVPGLKASL